MMTESGAASGRDSEGVGGGTTWGAPTGLSAGDAALSHAGA